MTPDNSKHNLDQLNEDEAIARINSLSKDDWEELLSLIPEIENATEFGVHHPMREVEKDVYTIPYSTNGPLINRFIEIIHEMPIIIPFDWSSWDEGRKMANDDHFDFNSIDIPTKCKLITALARNDRFCDGVLVEAFETGLMLQLLKSIKQQLNEPHPA